MSNDVRPAESGPARWRHLPGLLALLLLVAAVFRRHLFGEALFLGNFDRLNSFLNTLWLQVHAWRLGQLGGWDETMFMGRNLYALPFTYPNPLNYLVTWFPDSEFYWISGVISMGLQVLAGWCAYWFIHDVCRDRWAAFAGAAIYQFSALAVLKVSQNDMSFAVMIDIPLMLLALRRLDRTHFGRGFLALTAVLAHLLIFCFLQKVAYALLLGGLYTLVLAGSRRSWVPVLAFAAAGFVASIAAAPRILGILAELHVLQRQISPDFDMHDFAALYRWQNFHAYDVWRWFNDGLYGRFFQEVFALNNNMNITEGMLIFSGMLTPLLVIGGVFRWQGKWGGLFRTATIEVRFFYALIVVALGVVTSMTVYRVFWELFFRLDFTHTRFLIAALIPQSVLVALILARLRSEGGPTTRWHIGGGLLAGVLGCAAVYYAAGQPESAVPVALTENWRESARLPIRGFEALLSASGDAATSGSPIAWMNAAMVNRVSLTALTALLVAALALWSRTRRTLGAGLSFFLIGFMVSDVWSYANLQNNGSQVGGLLPFSHSHSYWPEDDTFLAPRAEAVNAVQDRLETDGYRSLLLSETKDLPYFTAPHIATTWGLRVVEGYSSGVPIRFAALPWPAWALGLRTMTFATHPPAEMPWGLLGFTNVKYALHVNAQEYRTGFDPANLKIVPNPARVTPRVFLPQSVELSPSLEASVAAFFPEKDPMAGPAIDPTQKTLVETQPPLPQLDQSGEARAEFASNTITVEVAARAAAQLVVLNELFHPDWHAYADGKEIPLLPVNVVMRGVLIPAGTSQVTLRFEPVGSLSNEAVAIGLALVLAAAIYAANRRLAHSRETANKSSLSAS